MRKLLGWAMLSLAFLIIFGFVVFCTGFKIAILVFGLGISFTFLVTKGIQFIVEL